jgi:transcriptional regulator with XRE-family HTH domain
MRQPTSVRRRLLGGALRQYRESLAYGIDVTASILGCDRSKVSRIETGERGIRPDDLMKVVEAYGLSEEQQDVLLAIAESSRRDIEAWWQEYTAILSGDRLEYLATEPYASHILAYGPMVIPELFWTQDYARAAAQARPDTVGKAIRARQAEVLDESTVPLTAVIGEAALRQQVGDRNVMQEQLHTLVDAADGAWTTVQVLPSTAGVPTVGGCGSFSVLQFGAVFTFGLVHLDGPQGGVCLDDSTDTAAYVEAFARMQATALNPDDSLALIRRVANS